MASPLHVLARISPSSVDDLRERVRRLDELGASGLLVTDHLFGVQQGVRVPRLDPLTTLAAAAMLTDRLELGTIVVNTAFLHPALVFRQFAQVAQLAGGDRVLAGIGAGWARDEFEALGWEIPPFAERMARFEETLQIGRALYDTGSATVAGKYVSVKDLPLAPRPERAPRLLIGGGSDDLLRLAGRYADVIDLNGSSRRIAVGGANPRLRDSQRRLTTTIADLRDSRSSVQAAAVEAGRSPDAVAISLLLQAPVFCSMSEVEREEARLCEEVGLPAQSLADCAYVLVGPPQAMAEKLQRLVAEVGAT
ncbi:MAG: LLM class flavin-dependent oxidoreductase, partial [Candidatus Dormiibacterota bacterium]